MLADGLAQTGNFAHTRPEDLEWPGRFQRMLRELDAGNPELVTLQECNHFDDSWRTAMAERGFDGVHIMKPASPATVYGAPSDGLALFWRRDLLELVREDHFQYSKYLDVPAGQCAVISHLRWKDRLPGSVNSVVLATTHLKAKESEANEKIRTGQSLELIEAVHDFTHALAADLGVNAARIPVLISGDFNTEPTSAAVQRVNGSVLKLESYWGALCGDHLPPCRKPIPDSMFSTWKVRKGEDPDFTGEKKRVIDYIWWRSGLFRPLRAWGPMCETDIGPSALPSAVYPSDHVSLLVELACVD